MKRNMKKVPIIQEKSEHYHELEDKEADEFITTQLQSVHEQGTIRNNKYNTHKEKTWLQQAIERLRKHIQTLYTLKQK